MKITVDLQIASIAKNIPSLKQFELWANTALNDYPKDAEICIRIVDEEEIQQLNSTYRHKNYPTNVLSFPYDELDPAVKQRDDDSKFQHEPNEDNINLLGDIAICASIILKEAKEQNIKLESHWAHIVIHGCLHLIGYTHDADEDAEKMESLEARLLKTLES